MGEAVNDEALDTLFRNARTHRVWQNKPVSDDILHALYDVMKWAPTSANCSPARILLLRTPEAKERLRPALAAGNVEKTMTAPVTAILAYDLNFHEKMAKLSPRNPAIADRFGSAPPEIKQTNAFRNGTLQGGYFIIAARAVGLDCGPMSGFDNAKVDQEFFPGQSIKSNFLCNLGYGDSSKLFPREPRLDFDEACKLL
jgi:3-hydroxypropanoate dehydrogenase